MSEPTASFVYDRRSAVKALRQGDPTRLLPALLAGLAPEASWEGTLIYQGESPIPESSSVGPPTTVCVGITGQSAEQVQQLLVEACERFGVQVLELYEGGPEVQTEIARVSDGRWVAP